MCPCTGLSLMLVSLPTHPTSWHVRPPSALAQRPLHVRLSAVGESLRVQGRAPSGGCWELASDAQPGGLPLPVVRSPAPGAAPGSMASGLVARFERQLGLKRRREPALVICDLLQASAAGDWGAFQEVGAQGPGHASRGV